MRFYFFIAWLIFFSSTGKTQPLVTDSSFVQKVNLPVTIPAIINKINQEYIYLTSDKDIYHLFGYDSMVNFRHFDFTNFHILGIKNCMQCKNQQLHSPDCNKEWRWIKRQNSKAFTKIDTLFPTNIPFIHANIHKTNFLTDTIIQPTSSADSAIIQWHTTGHGDCHGWFTYDLLKDNFNPFILLKEWSHYGGCRAAGSRRTILYFKQLPNISCYYKTTILVE